MNAPDFPPHRHPGVVTILCSVLLLALLCLPVRLPAAPAGVADALFETVVERARVAAQTPMAPSATALPPELLALDYDQYRAIRFRPESAVWRGQSPFELQLFHPGYLFTRPVTIHLVEDGAPRELPFDPSVFRYDPPATGVGAALPDSLGWAGFRVHYPLHTPAYADEFLVFLGASFFRMVGRDQGYGLSARGVAVNTATPGGEEFPAFRAFWILRPEADQHDLTILALLDSPSLTGAYRFDVRPGADTVLTVEAVLFAREDIGKLGVAPLTSMYAHGDTSGRWYDDHRPRVHDSEGLLVRHSHGEWVWRPLSNPASLRVTGFMDGSAAAFGLIQRSREFADYLDLEAGYERRPSQWVEPLDGDWGSGRVELVEIPSPDETHDNIVAYWVPERALRAGDSVRFRYRTRTLGAGPAEQTLARVVRTRHGWGAVPGTLDPPAPSERRHFTVLFRGGELASLRPGQPVQLMLETTAGEVSAPRLARLADGETWAASFLLAPEPGQVADLRLHLALYGRPLSETWSFLWSPDVLEPPAR